MTPFEKDDATILAESREYLEQNGWWKGSLLGPNGKQVCAMGAVVYSQGWTETTIGMDLEKSGLVRRILHKLEKVLPLMFRHEEITCWNDNHAKSKQEVLDLFAKAEKIERAGFDPDVGIEL